MQKLKLRCLKYFASVISRLSAAAVAGILPLRARDDLCREVSEIPRFAFFFLLASRDKIFLFSSPRVHKIFFLIYLRGAVHLSC
jgi:hypothetical protein